MHTQPAATTSPRQTASNTIVRLRDVHRTFNRATAPVRALRGVNLDIDGGSFAAIMGPSGCGKSTLLHVMAGIDTADEGHVEVAGHRLSALDDDDRAVIRRRHIGMVFQFFNLIEDMTALENVRLASGLIQRPREADRRARATLDLVAMGHEVDVPVGLLSGGQRQRTAIARALVNDPSVILADEPTGALDQQGASEILELFRRISETGQTIVMVTHDANVAKSADTVHRLHDGRLITD